MLTMWYSFPETTQKTLEEIAGIFGDEVAVKIDEADKSVDLQEIQAHDVENKTVATDHIEKVEEI